MTTFGGELDGYPPGAIWRSTDPHDEQVREVYARYGLAMFQAQVLEHGMVNAMLVLSLLPTIRTFKDDAAWEAAFDRFYDVELAKTFGNMLNRLEPLDGFPPDLLTRLRAAKLQRDHLAHRFFREHDIDFMTADGRTKMIAECENIIVLFRDLDRKVEAFAKPERERFGITDEWIDKHVRMMEVEAAKQGA